MATDQTKSKFDVAAAKGTPELAIFPLFLVSLFLSASLILSTLGWLRCVLIYVILEVFFYLYQRARLHLLEDRVRGPIFSVVRDPFAHGIEAFERFLHYYSEPRLGFSFERFLSGWFSDTPYERIGREDLKDLVAYGFFYVDRKEFEARWGSETLEALTARLEARFPVSKPLRPGRGDVKARTHLWDPLPFLHIPLALYLVSEFSGLVAHAILTHWGFRVHRCTAGRSTRAALVSPWCYVRHAPHAKPSGVRADDDPSRSPLVFLHGIGIGLLPYLGFVWRWRGALGGERPIVLMPMDQVACRLSASRPVSADQSAQDLERMLGQMGFRDCTVVGHSYGTFVAAQLCRRAAEARHPPLPSAPSPNAPAGSAPAVSVAGCVLIDPVCLCLNYPTLTYKFVYKPFVKWPLAGLKRDAGRYIFSRELMISATMCRRFYWSTHMAWPDSFPPLGGVVSLANNDILLQTDLIANQLAAQCPHVQLLHHPAHGHGEFLGEPAWQWKIISATLDMIEGRYREARPRPFELPSDCVKIEGHLVDGTRAVEVRDTGLPRDFVQLVDVAVGPSPVRPSPSQAKQLEGEVLGFVGTGLEEDGESSMPSLRVGFEDDALEVGVSGSDPDSGGADGSGSDPEGFVSVVGMSTGNALFGREAGAKFADGLNQRRQLQANSTERG